MHNLRISAITALLLTALSLNACSPQPSTRVIRAVDGDTLLVSLENSPNRKVRIIGIDTPETVDPRKPVQCYGPEASRRMHSLADGNAVTLESKPDEDKDPYGRLLRYVTVDGEDLGARMIAEGYARSLRAFPHPRMQRYNKLEAQAKQAHLGRWSACRHQLQAK